MSSRLFSAVVLLALFISPAAAQTIRFDTNVGTFDMELNPTGNPGLQGHVDNILSYVNAGRYEQVVINRAAENFVLQLAGFTTNSLNLPGNFSDFDAVPSFGNVIVDEDLDGVADFDITGLSNTRGTVSLALSGPLNSGSSSFFASLVDNTGSLDPQGFIPFATIPDMATIDLILSLEQASLSDGNQGPSLASQDIPILSNNRLVVVERVFVVETLPAVAAALAGEEEILLNEVGGLLHSLGSDFSSNQSASLQALSVPEPPALVLAVGALVMIYVMKPSKIR